MTPFIDTNVFLRYLVFDKKNPSLSKKAKNIIEKLVKGKLTLQTNLLVVSEMVFVLAKYYRLSKDDVSEKVAAILSIKNLTIEKKPQIISALEIYSEKNIDFEDAYTYVEMQEKDVDKIYTFDKKHFNRLEGINILPK